MNLRSLSFPLLVVVLFLGACDSSESTVPPDVVARAGGVDFTAETAGRILAPQSQLPNQSVVVDALANLWVDYFLLARLIAEDSTLATLDVSPLVQQTTEQEMVFNLREQVIQFDTTFTDEELREIYERELPGTRIRARHILLRFPEEATEAQVDSVWALAESIRDRALAGENFALLAGEFSQDRGTASSGGDLGTFTRGQMVPQFEEVAFNMDVGAVSEVVETTFGLHIIKLEERIVPPFDENLDQFRVQMKNRRIAEAESTYVANVLDAAELEILEDGFETARQLANDPSTPLTPRAEDRVLFRFRDGEFTVADYRDWVMLRPLGVRDEIRKADDQRLNAMMRNIARERLLVRQAGLEGIEVTEAHRDSLATIIRSGVKTVARQLGFFEMVSEAKNAEGEDLDQAVNDAVVRFLGEVVQERQDVVPLGGVSMALRRQFDTRVYPTGVQQAQDIIAGLRTQERPPAAPEGTRDTTGSDGSGDSGSGGDVPDGAGRNP